MFSNMLKAFAKPNTIQRMYSTAGGEKSSVLIIGGNNSLGRSLTEKLAPHASKITVTCLNTSQEYNRKNKFENVHARALDIAQQSQVEPIVQEHDVVINLVGPSIEIDHQFFDTHVQGPKHIAFSAKKHHIKNLIHVSALGASFENDNAWLDWKYRGEDMVYGCFPDATIVRPSLMFSKNETNSTAYANLIARAYRLSPLMILPTAPMVAPVEVNDVAEAIAKVSGVLPDKVDAVGKVLLLEGPEALPFTKAMDKLTGKKSLKSHILNEFILCATQFLPGAHFTRDHLNLWNDITIEELNKTTYDDRVKRTWMSFEDLNITPNGLSKM